MTFVAAPSSISAASVAGDGWYPALSVDDFRTAMRIPATVTVPRTAHALTGGMLSAAAELVAWRAAQEMWGRASLADAIVKDPAGRPRAPIAGEPIAVVLWRRAVYAYAAADLAETHGDITATTEGRQRNEERAAGAFDLLRTATLAIRDLIGADRTTVALL